jgi:hypothetical protein
MGGVPKFHGGEDARDACGSVKSGGHLATFLLFLTVPAVALFLACGIILDISIPAHCTPILFGMCKL